MQWVDKLYFQYNKFKYQRENASFVKAHPSFAMPPVYMLYEAYKLSYREYFKDGQDTARELVNRLQPYINFSGASLLEWGCGPGRIVRHLPLLLPQTKIYGSDYNAATITWCKAHISNVHFSVNGLNPPLPFQNQTFNAIYAISVFTHLAEKSHYLWIEELYRGLKADGLLLFTSQGNVFAEKLTKEEQQSFGEGNVVVHGFVKEGHRSFSAFHPERFVQTLLQDRFKVLEFIPGKKQSWGLEQDTWIVQRV